MAKRQLESLLEDALVLEVSPYLKREVVLIREQHGLTRPTTGTEGETPPIALDEVDWEQMKEDVYAGEYLPRAVEELMTRYDFRCRFFFEQMLLTGVAPPHVETRRHLTALLKSEQSEKWAALLNRGTIRIETDPAYPQWGILPGRFRSGRPAYGWLTEDLRSIRIDITPSTTLDEVKRIWPRVKALQKRMIGRGRSRRRKSDNIKRDLALYAFVMVDNLTAAEAVTRWDSRSDFGAAFPQYNVDYIEKEIIPRLDKRMRPRWERSWGSGKQLRLGLQWPSEH